MSSSPRSTSGFAHFVSWDQRDVDHLLEEFDASSLRHNAQGSSFPLAYLNLDQRSSCVRAHWREHVGDDGIVGLSIAVEPW